MTQFLYLVFEWNGLNDNKLYYAFLETFKFSPRSFGVKQCSTRKCLTIDEDKFLLQSFLEWLLLNETHHLNISCRSSETAKKGSALAVQLPTTQIDRSLPCWLTVFMCALRKPWNGKARYVSY